MSDTSPSPTAPPDLHLLDTTVGLLLDGYVLTMISYGFIIFQAYRYYSKFPSDNWLLKSEVTILCAMDTAAVAVLTKALHVYLIVQFPITYAGVDNATTTYCVDNLLAVIEIFIVQLAYSHRIWNLTKSMLLSLSITIIAAAACALGLVMSARMFQQQDLDLLAINPSKAIVACCQALTFLAACITFSSLCLYVEPHSKSETISKMESFIDRCTELCVDRGGAATLIQFAYLISFLVSPSNRYWILFQLNSRRLFVLGFITMLNSRGVVHGKGLYLKESGTLALSGTRSITANTSNTRSLSSSFSKNLKSSKSQMNTPFKVNISRTVEHDTSSIVNSEREDGVPADKEFGNKLLLTSEDH